MFASYDRFKDETCLFGVHSSCIVVELCFKRVHIGKRRCCRLPRESNDQVHVVKQGVLGLYLDSSSHKLKRPKKLTSRWTVLTRCEKTGQHTLHVCKSESPDSSVKDSFPVQTSWSIKSSHCLKSSQRMDIFKEEGFIIHMGRQIAYISCSARSEVKSWMCAILEGVTLGFEYHCRVGKHKSLEVAGECMLVLTPECIALLCPLTGAPLRKWPFFLLTGCSVIDDTVYWMTSECDLPFKATINQHNIFTLYNVLCRYLSHTNAAVQPDVSISKPESGSRKGRQPAENKYTVREPLPQREPATSESVSSTGLCTNQLYLPQETLSEKMNYELLSSNHSDYSTGVSSAGSTYDSDIYELMENSSYQHTHDCIYEDMTSTSPLTDEGYMTSSGSVTSSNHPGSVSSGNLPSTSRFRFSSRGSRPAPPSVYMNMENKSRDQEATLVPDAKRGQVSRETSRDTDATLRAPCYEYIDIQFPGERPDQPPSPVAPPCLPSRNKRPSQPAPITDQSRDKLSEGIKSYQDQSRDKLSEGIKSYQEQSRLQHEMMVNFSASLLGSNSRGAVSAAQSRGFSAV